MPVQGAASAEDEGCKNSGMMAMIKAMGSSHGDKEGCVICHGGDPAAKDANSASPMA